MTGIAGMRYNGQNYSYVRDAFGNVIKLMRRSKLVAEYHYDVWGNSTVKYICTDAADRNVADTNPIRWKSHYYDTDTKVYYMGGRYYDPYLMKYLDADDPEKLLENIATPNALDRNGITVDNGISVAAYMYTVFPSLELYPDPNYDPDMHKSWWELNWKKALQVTLFAATLLASLIMLTNPATFCLGVGMLIAGLKGAVSGLIAGAVIGGIMGYGTGKFWESVAEGALYGTMNGFTVGALSYAAYTGVTGKQSCCFVAGTLVHAEDGEKAIEEIEAGDFVWAYDENTGEKALKRVVRLFGNSTLVTHHLSFDEGSEPIVCTPEHPFYILNATNDREIVLFEGRDESKYEGQWVQAKYLKVDDKVLLSDGKTAILTKTETVHLSEPITTYNFEVQDFHTYYVSEQGILVHNDCVVQTGNSKNVEIYDTFDEAFARAKQLGGVADDQLVSITQARSNTTGRFMQGKHYNYVRINRAGKPVNTSILHHSGGHPQLDMSSHINVLSQKGSLNYHLFYRRF